MKGHYVKKRRDSLVLLLDDAFDSPVIAEQLRAAGFERVERFTDKFPGLRKKTDPTTVAREQSVIDPRVIHLSHQKGWLIVTTDSNMRFTHVEEIKRNPNAAILSTAHNSDPNPLVWVKALITGKAAIERTFRKTKLPWVAQFDRSGKITTCYTVTENHSTRRNRPREQGISLAV